MFKRAILLRISHYMSRLLIKPSSSVSKHRILKVALTDPLLKLIKLTTYIVSIINFNNGYIYLGPLQGIIHNLITRGNAWSVTWLLMSFPLCYNLASFTRPWCKVHGNLPLHVPTYIKLCHVACIALFQHFPLQIKFSWVFVSEE
jgi:hypothetical protein